MILYHAKMLAFHRLRKKAHLRELGTVCSSIVGRCDGMRAGTEILVKTERPEVSISLSEMAKDSWVVFELPGFATATSGKQQDSIEALRKATETSYFKGPDAVWVKLVIPTAPKGIGMDQFGPSDTEASITVRR